jgi:transcriptional regulator with XRE-family HTH domain
LAVPRSGVPGFSAARLRAAREQAGLSPARLAEAAGTTRGSISKYLSGHARPQADRLPALARALGVPVSSLLDLPEGGEGLAHIRAAAGLTQARLAERSGTDLKRYEAAEAGRRPLTETDIRQIAAAAGVSVSRVRCAHGRDVSRYRERREPAPEPASTAAPSRQRRPGIKD